MSSAKQILICVTQVLCITCFAQRETIDSLKKILPLLKDTSRIDCINELSFQYTRLLIRDSAEYFESLAYKESEKINYVHGIAEAVTNQSGIIEYFDNDFIQGEALARRSLALFEKTNNKRGIENTTINLFFSLFAQSKYDEAYIIALKKCEDSKRLNDSFQMINALENLAMILDKEGNYDSAFYFYKQAQNIATISKNKLLISDLLYSFGTLYKAIGDYETAINYYRKVFQTDTRETIQNRIDNSYETWIRMEFAELLSLRAQFDSAWHYYNLFDTSKITTKDLRIYLVSTGETYLLQKNYNEALPNLLRGLEIHRKLNDRNEIKRTLLDLAKTYFELGDNILALQYAREGLEMSLQTKSRQFIRNGYQILYLVYDRLNKIDSAYFYYKKYIAIKDSVVSDQTKGRYAAYKYEEEINSLNDARLISQQKLKIQQQQLAQGALERKIGLAVFIGLLLMGGIAFRNILLKRKHEKTHRELAENELKIQKLETQQQLSELEMQALRAQMNPHFIFNSLNSINRFILQNNRQQASEYLTKFSKLVRLILQNSQTSLITLESELEALELYLELEALRFNNRFSYKISVSDDIDSEVVKVPPLIIQPYTENAIWHGLMHKESKGNLEIEIYREDNVLFCKITDNGIGRKKAGELKSKSAATNKSMGMRITADRIKILNREDEHESTVTVNDLVAADGSAGGTEVIIKIPCYD